MLINEKDQAVIQERFQELENKVTLVFFETTLDCEYCATTKQLVEELSALSDKLDFVVYNLHADDQIAAKYRVTRAPALVLLDDKHKDYGIKFYGIPSGYEFSTLLEDILMVSTGKTTLSKDTIDALQKLSDPVHLQVFVTPTCPYCPNAVRLAHMAAFVSDQVTGDMVEASEFPELSQKYTVYGVPKTIVNEVGGMEGAVPEKQFLEEVLKAVMV